MSNFKCNECGAEIAPEWKGAISKNECPGCLGSIMDEEQQALILELGGAMRDMPHDPIGVAGWLVSSYKLTKIGDCELVDKFHDKSNKVVQVEEQTLQKENKVSAFFERSGYNVDKIKEGELAKNKIFNNDVIETNFENSDGDYIDEINELMESNNEGDLLEKSQIKQKECQYNVANGIGAISKSGSPAGFRRM